MDDLVSVIIPTYNRFKYLMNTIKSINDQTYKNIEIIVINDCSTQKEYYEYDWKINNINIIHLEENSKNKLGFGCAAYVRNNGLKYTKGKYIAFCDDDDIWFPNKIELQLKSMKETGCKMSSTEGYIGNGIYNPNNKYKKYNSEYFYFKLKKIYNNKKSNLLDNGFPKIWNLDFLKIHNCIICSSVILEKEIIDKIGEFKLKNYAEDYDYWLRALKYTNSVYVNEVCFYYNKLHGDGRNY